MLHDIWLDKLASGRPSNLFGLPLNYEENEVLCVNAAPQAVFTTLHFIQNLQIDPIS